MVNAMLFAVGFSSGFAIAAVLGFVAHRNMLEELDALRDAALERELLAQTYLDEHPSRKPSTSAR